MLPITKKTSTKHTAVKNNRDLTYIAIHYTAGTKSTTGKAEAVAKQFATSSTEASADFIVDDGSIIQYNPDIKNRYCYAVGGNKYNTKGGSLYGKAKNNNTISIEICSTNTSGKVPNANDKTWKFTDAAINNAVDLTKYLMKTYNIKADHVVRHYDITGKLCPGIVGWNKDSGSETKWTEFKNKLTATPKSELPKIAEPSLKKGSDGTQVKYLQQDLNYLGFKGKDGKVLTVDGSFGTNVEYAVKAFQKKYGLEVDGSYGKKSYEKMKTLIK